MEINVLQAQRRKYKSKFNTNVHTVTEKFQAVEEQISDSNTRLTTFMDHMEGNTSGVISDIQARIDDLVNDNEIHHMSIDELRRRFDLWDMHEDNNETEKMQEESEGAQKYLTALKNSIDGMLLFSLIDFGLCRLGNRTEHSTSDDRTRGCS